MVKPRHRSSPTSARLTLAACVAGILLALAACTDDDDSDGHQGPSGSDQLLDMSPRASLIVDVNNDGLNDLIVDTDQSDRTRNLLLLNQGDYRFEIHDEAFPARYGAPEGTTVALENGHFNDDNHLDIIAITVDLYETSKIQVYFGDGMGNFEDAGDVVSGPGIDENGVMTRWPEWIRVADFDNDGYDDFFLTTPGLCEDYCNRIYLNDGAGNFSVTNITFDDGVNTYTSDTLEWAPDGSPDPDSPDERRVFIGDVFLHDLNADGAVDMFSPASFQQVAMASFINRSNGPGDVRFEVRFSKAQGEIRSDDQPQIKNGVLADVNHDGFPDLIGSRSITSTLDPEDGVPVLGFLNTGDGTMNLDNDIIPDSVKVTHARQWLSIDADQDGSDEVFVADHGDDFDPYPGMENVLLFYQQDGTLENQVAERLSDKNSYTHGASVGDLNGDGYPDLFLNNGKPSENIDAEPEKRFWINDGNGNFSAENPEIR